MNFNLLLISFLSSVSVQAQSLDVIRQRACDAAQRVSQNQTRLEKEKSYAKVGGFADKENIYRASRGIVEGRKELKEAIAEYESASGEKYTDADLRKCDYFSGRGGRFE